MPVATLNTTVALLGELLWRPALSPLHILALAVLMALLAIAVYIRSFAARPLHSAGLLVMRLVVIAALAILLMGPSTVHEYSSQPGRGAAIVLLDTSGSMLTEDCGPQSRLRYVIGRWLSPEKLAALEKDNDLRLIGFDETLRALSTSALEAPEQLIAGRSTNYAETLRSVLADLPAGADPPAIVLLGDGHDTEQRSLQPATALARQRGVPVYAIGVGSSFSPRDLALVAVPRQEYLMSGETGQIVATVFQSGADDAATVLRLRGEGVSVEQPLRFAGRAAMTVELPIERDEPGIYEYTVSVDSLEDETVADNNTQTVFVEVTAKRIRVLVLEGEPYWDTKFLAQALRADTRIELSAIAQVTPARPQTIVTRSETQGLRIPQTAQQFAEYDIIVLGRGIQNVLAPDAAAALLQHVSSGAGHIVFARGLPYDLDAPAGREMHQQLAALDPVLWAVGAPAGAPPKPLSLTFEGLAHPAFAFTGLPGPSDEILAALPPLTSLSPIAGLKPATRVLASAGDAPAIVSMPYGGGRVFAVLGDGLWQWSLLPPRLSRFRGAFESFWANAVRGIALAGEFQPGQDVSLRLARTSLRLGDEQTLDVTLKHSPPAAFAPSLRLIGPDGQAQPAALQQTPGLDTRYRVTFQPQQAGAWTAVLDAPPLSPARQVRRFSVYDLNIERLRTEARPQVLRDLAQQTGGQFFSADEDVDLTAQLARQRMARIVPPQPLYIWDQPWIMMVLLTWMGLEWIARRQSGLL